MVEVDEVKIDVEVEDVIEEEELVDVVVVEVVELVGSVVEEEVPEVRSLVV